VAQRDLKNEGNVSREMLPLCAPNFSPQLIMYIAVLNFLLPQAEGACGVSLQWENTTHMVHEASAVKCIPSV